MTDWNVGDVALCVDNRHDLGGRFTVISEGAEYMVTRLTTKVGASVYAGEGIPKLCLCLLGVDYHGFDARRFIKQPPRVSEDERVTDKELEYQ